MQSVTYDRISTSTKFHSLYAVQDVVIHNYSPTMNVRTEFEQYAFNYTEPLLVRLVI